MLMSGCKVADGYGSMLVSITWLGIPNYEELSLLLLYCIIEYLLVYFLLFGSISFTPALYTDY
jgi:hypothetical protein